MYVCLNLVPRMELTAYRRILVRGDKDSEQTSPGANLDNDLRRLVLTKVRRASDHLHAIHTL